MTALLFLPPFFLLQSLNSFRAAVEHAAARLFYIPINTIFFSLKKMEIAKNNKYCDC